MKGAREERETRMDEWMDGEGNVGADGRTGCGDGCQEKETGRMEGRETDWLEEKRGAERLGDMRETDWQSDVV